MVLEDLVRGVNSDLKALRAEAVQHENERFVRLLDNMIRITTIDPEGDEQARAAAAAANDIAATTPECTHEHIGPNGNCEQCGKQIASLATCTHSDGKGNLVLDVFGRCLRCKQFPVAAE